MLKRTFLLLLLVSSYLGVLCGQNAFSYKEQMGHKEPHEHKGRFFVGGVINYWYDADDKQHSFEFAPEFGYLFNNDWGLGAFLSYDYGTELSTQAKKTSHFYSITPFVRYYYFHREPFNLYLDGCVGVNWSKEIEVPHTTPDAPNVESMRGFEVGIRPGACVDLTEGLCLCLRLGFIGYRNSFFAGEEEGVGTSGWGVRFAPEELKIGLELEF